MEHRITAWLRSIAAASLSTVIFACGPADPGPLKCNKVSAGQGLNVTASNGGDVFTVTIRSDLYWYEPSVTEVAGGKLLSLENMYSERFMIVRIDQVPGGADGGVNGHLSFVLAGTVFDWYQTNRCAVKRTFEFLGEKLVM